MSKKKQKRDTDIPWSIALQTATLSRKLDEILDVLHVIAENTKKPEPLTVRVPGRPVPAEQALKYGYDFKTSEEDMARRRADYEAMRRVKAVATEEVEDYHGIAPSGDSPYAPVVRLR